MENVVHTEEYRGLTIQIIQDHDAQSPEEWGDEDLFLITTNNRYFQVDRTGFNMDGAASGDVTEWTEAQARFYSLRSSSPDES